MASKASPRKPPQIKGIYELGHVLYTLGADLHGFAKTDIERIERFWTFGDYHSSAGGFLFRLHDGRRAYAELQHTHAYEQIEDFRVEVQMLAEGQADPVMPPALEPREWTDDAAHLDRVLQS